MKMINLIKKYVERNLKNEICSKWKILMERIYDVDTNKDNNYNAVKLSKYYTIDSIVIKKYGFDIFVNIPIGKNLNTFLEILPHISVVYNTEVISFFNEDKKMIHLKCHLVDLDINPKDDILFKWNQYFYNIKEKNQYGETFKLKKCADLNHPTKKDSNNNASLIGYQYAIDIPTGLSYNALEKQLPMLNKIFGICCLSFNDETKEGCIQILFNKVPDDEKYVPIKVKPWEFYCAMTHYYQPIVLDFKHYPNALIGGTVNTGKTTSMLMGILSLVLSNDESLVQLFICMLSSKQDLQILKNIPHCKYYASTIKESLKELRYLENEIKRRNKLFFEQGSYGEIVNIFEYNNVANEKLPFLHFCVDEIAALTEEKADDNDTIKNMKKTCGDLMKFLAREGRTVGIYCIYCTQRAGAAILDVDIKGLLVNQISFYFPNTTSAYTILGEDSLAELATHLKPSREIIAKVGETYTGKTLSFNMKILVNNLKPIFNNKNNCITLSDNGEIRNENEIKKKKQSRYEKFVK